MAPRTLSKSAKTATLVYDGDCGFCSTSVRWLEANLPAMPTTVPFQWADLELLGLTIDEARDRVWLVVGDSDSDARPGHQYGGHLAVSAMLRRQPRASLRMLGWLLVTPGFSTIAGIAYELVARYRYRLPGGTPACRVTR